MVAAHARGEPTLAFEDRLLFLHGNFFPEFEMELIKKEYEATLFISLTHLYPGELTKSSSAVLVEILVFINIDI